MIGILAIEDEEKKVEPMRLLTDAPINTEILSKYDDADAVGADDSDEDLETSSDEESDDEDDDELELQVHPFFFFFSSYIKFHQ